MRPPICMRVLWAVYLEQLFVLRETSLPRRGMPNGANHVLPRSEFHMMGPLVSGTSLRKRPERLFGRHKLDQHVFHQRFHPPYALLHARLLGGHVSNHDQCLLLPLAGRVRCIFHRFPLPAFSHQQYFHVVHFQCVCFPFESRRSWAQRQLCYFHFWISHYPQHRSIQPLRHIRCQFLQRNFRHCEQVRILRALVFPPTQRLYHAGQAPVRISQVPVVVESPDHHSVLLDKVPFLLPHRVVLLHSLRPVQVIVKRRLVRDDQVLPVCRRALQHVHRCHHRHGNPRHARVRIPGLERVYSFRVPRHANMLLNRRYYFPCRRPLFLRLGCQSAHRSRHHR